MAKQVGPLFITGTIDGVIFYKLNGQYLMRSKGDYRSGKQMRKDPCLKRTMQNADQFGVASKIVKYTYYRYLPPAVRKWGLYGELTGMVKRWLQAGKSNEEAEELLIAFMKTLVPAEVTEAARSGSEAAPVLPLHSAPTMVVSGPKPAVVKPASCRKQARYLSKWKVKRNGRLCIPITAVDNPVAVSMPGNSTAYQTSNQELRRQVSGELWSNKKDERR